MAFTYKQRKDGGFDFFNDLRKTTIEDYVKNTGANQNNLRTMMAQKGDQQSQRIAGTLPVQFSANNRPGLTIKTPTLNPVATLKPTSTVVEPIVQPIQQRPVTPMAAPVLQKQATLQQANQPQRLQVARPQTQTNLSVAPTQRNQWEQEKFDRLEPLFKQNKSFEDMAKVAGYSNDEVRKYADANHKNYGDQGIIKNTINGVGGFVNTMAKNAAGIVTKPVADLTVDKNSVQNELMDINTKFQNGAISEAAAMERANEIANRFTNKSVRVENGWITVKTGNIGEFAGKFAQQGIDTASVLPMGGAVATAGARAAGKAGMTKTTGLLSKASDFMTGGAGVINQGSRLAPQATRMADKLTAVGMSKNAADTLSRATISNAVQSGVNGTAQTGADIASGRGVTPESLLMNYGADFVMGTGMELGTGALLKGGAKAIDLVPTAKKMADSHPQILGMLAETDKLFEQKNALLSRGMSPNSAAVVGVNKAIKAAGAEYNRVYKQVYDAAKLELQRGFIAGPLALDFSKAKAAGQVFDGVDGKPRFEVDDSGAKYKQPTSVILKDQLKQIEDKNAQLTNKYWFDNSSMTPSELKAFEDANIARTKINEQLSKSGELRFSDIVDHPELYKNYPELADIKVELTGAQELNGKGSFNPTTKVITLDSQVARNPKQALSTLIHEAQHSIQEKEGFAKGSSGILSGDTHEQYLKTAGEAEARAVQARMDMPMSERYVKPEGQTLYHGSDAEFDEMMVGRPTKRRMMMGEYDTTSNGMFFTSDKNVAREYGKNVGEYSVDVKNPLDFRDRKNDAIFDEFDRSIANDDSIDLKPGEPGFNEFMYFDGKLGEKFVKFAKSKGFDGAKIRETSEFTGDDFDSIIAFDNKQVSKAKPRSTFYDSLDVPKKDLIIRNDGGKAMSIDDPTAALKQEALKYKTAEEFVKSQSPYYHRTNADFSSFDTSKQKSGVSKGMYLMDNAEQANTPYMVERFGKNLKEAYPTKPVADLTNDPELSRLVGNNAATPKLEKILKDRGYAGYKFVGETVVFDPKDLVTKQQLTDLYNQAHTQPTPKVEAPKSAPTQKTPQPTVAPTQKPKQPSAFEQDLQKAGLGAKKSSYASQSKETKKAIDAHIAKEYPELGHHMTADSQFPNGVPKVRPEDVRRITGMSPRELGIPPRYISKNALPMDMQAVEYEMSVRGNDGELKMTDEDYLNLILDKVEAGRASAKVTQKLRELRNDPNVISKASATLEAEKAYYAPDDGFELSKADSNAYAKMVAKANQEKPGTSVGTKAKAQQPSRVSKTTPIQQPSATLAAKTSKTSQLARVPEQELTSTPPLIEENQVSTSSRSYADNTTSEVKKRGFTQSVENSDEVSGQVRRKVSGEYNVRSTKNLALNADDYVKGDIDVVSKDVNSRLDTPLGKVTDQDIADSIAVAKRLDGMGKFDESQAIYDKLAEHGTRGGQAIQAFSLLQNRTPEGVKFQMLKHLKKAGVELTKADQKTVGGLIDEVRKTKVGTEARDRALFNTLDYVSRKIPTSSSDKLVNLWRAGLLTAPKTTAGNILGNTTELATQKLWASPVAVATDKFFSMFTGKRTKTIGAGTTRGMVEGTAKGFDYLKTGFDPRNAGNMKYDAPRRVNYKNKILDTYVNGVYRWMGAQDQPFYYGAKAAAAHDLAKADGINLGYKGQKLAEYVEASVSDGSWQPQTFKTKKDVTDYAKYAVYQNETMLGSMASGLKQGAGRFKGGRAITDFILPFTQVPSSVAMRIIDRTPIGIIKEAVSQFKKGSFDQRAMAEAIGNGSFGIPVIAAGFALANSGDLTGQYPTDQKEQQLWEAEGKQPYSVKIDGKWYSLNYMQPFGTLMAIGKQVSDDKKDGKSDAEAWLNASGAAAKSVESQSFLQGLNGVLSAVNDPKRSMNQWAKSTASSVVPNFVRSGATAADDKQRETKTPFDAFKGSIPGVRQTLPVKRDMFGKDLEARDDFVNQYANPLKPSKVRNADDATTQELRRLQDAKNGIVTTEFDKKAISGVELNDEQVRNLNQLVNTEVKDQWDKAIQSAGYKDLSDEDKADYLKKIKDGVADHVKEQFVSDNSINTTGEYGNKTIPNGPSNTAEKSYADKYQLAQDDWNKNNASYSPVEKMKKQRDLAMLKVQKDYDNDSVALYGMGEKNIYAFLDQQDEKTSARYYGTLLKYGDALEAAGLGANKLRDKYGNAQYKKGYSVASSKGSRRSSTRRSGTSKTTIASILAGNKSINDMNNSTYLELNRLLSGVSRKSSQPKTLGRKVALKKISSKGVRS